MARGRGGPPGSRRAPSPAALHVGAPRSEPGHDRGADLPHRPGAGRPRRARRLPGRGVRPRRRPPPARRGPAPGPRARGRFPGADPAGRPVAGSRGGRRRSHPPRARGRAGPPAPDPTRRRPRDHRPRATSGRRGARRPDRPLHAAASDRRGGHGRRLPGRAGRPDPPPRGPEGHQTRHGHRPNRRPVRGRAPGPGPDGPPEHRQGPRRRRHRGRSPLLRDGAGQGRADHRVLRRRPPDAPRAAGAVPARLPGDPARRTRRGSSTATSSRRTSW